MNALFRMKYNIPPEEIQGIIDRYGYQPEYCWYNITAVSEDKMTYYAGDTKQDAVDKVWGPHYWTHKEFAEFFDPNSWQARIGSPMETVTP